jgi:hypothetical protein
MLVTVVTINNKFSPNFSTISICLKDKESPICKIITTELDFSKKKGINNNASLMIWPIFWVYSYLT